MGRAMLCPVEGGRDFGGQASGVEPRRHVRQRVSIASRGWGDQFNLPAVVPEPPPPAWLEAVGRFLKGLFEPIGRFVAWIGSFLPDAPYARILLWSVIALAAAALVVVIVQRVRHGEWRWPTRRAPPVIPVEEEWRPEAAPLRAWLEEADLLARDGRYAAAIHCLLLRAIDDLARRRPQLARPSLTGRELSQSPLLPVRAQTLFASIAGIVERSLFGNRLVDECQWNEARRSYSEFALGGSWQR